MQGVRDKAQDCRITKCIRDHSNFFSFVEYSTLKFSSVERFSKEYEYEKRRRKLRCARSTKDFRYERSGIRNALPRKLHSETHSRPRLRSYACVDQRRKRLAAKPGISVLPDKSSCCRPHGLKPQEDLTMKSIFLGAVLGVFLASPLFAEQQGDFSSRRSSDYQQRRPLRAADPGIESPTRKLAPNAESSNGSLCRTAPGFCPDYHGSNGS